MASIWEWLPSHQLTIWQAGGEGGRRRRRGREMASIWEWLPSHQLTIWQTWLSFLLQLHSHDHLNLLKHRVLSHAALYKLHLPYQKSCNWGGGLWWLQSENGCHHTSSQYDRHGYHFYYNCTATATWIFHLKNRVLSHAALKTCCLPNLKPCNLLA